MDNSYDEVISENPFYIDLKNEYTSLYQHCITNSWIICVPRIGTLSSRIFTVEDFCAHILVPNDELPETHYSTLTEKQVTVINNVITLNVTKGLPLQSHVLFEETFYTEDFLKHKIWCIETPLEPNTIDTEQVVSKNLQSVRDCINLLWTQAAGRQVLDQIETFVQNFLKKNHTLPSLLGPLKDCIGELYTQCLQIALQNKRLRDKSKNSKHMLESIKLSVESYVQYLIYGKIFKPICTCSAYKDSHLNKKIRNLFDLQLRDLAIHKDLYQAVLKAKQILSTIANYSTVLEKTVCIKETLNTLQRKDNNDKVILLSADEMLPVFVFLVLKSGLPNWYSQLTYMKEFCFSGSSIGDETSFLITTLEAVIEHILSGALTGSPHPEDYYYESELPEEYDAKNETDSESRTNSINCEESLQYLFELIQMSQKDLLKQILERNQKNLSSIQENYIDILDIISEDNFLDCEDDDNEDMELCHPLCICKNCTRKTSKNLLKASPTVISRDSHGLTVLHMACLHGRAEIVELLLELGSDVNVGDLNEWTPLHYAASRGHQNALLLLIHSNANINCTNTDKNTPLHLAANNGHLNCAKALVYFAEHSKINININAQNENGNTPLHFAAKWGYEGIVKLLIENGAESSLQNRNNKSAFDYAHNLRILKILKSCTPNLFEYIHISSFNVKTLNWDDDNVIKTAVEINDTDSASASSSCQTVEHLKRMERILKAISYGDVKLACFYMSINYGAFNDSANANCHPLCECDNCKSRNDIELDFDVNSSDTNGDTALHYASLHGLRDLCYILIQNKANVNHTNKKGQTPLHLAAMRNKVSIIQLLLDSGGNLNGLDSTGNSPLHEASLRGNVCAAKIILNYNPDTSIVNGSNKSALDVARDKVHLTMIDLIENFNDMIKL